jgi:hypothetical protein
MWEPQPLTTLRASKACRGENFTFTFIYIYTTYTRPLSVQAQYSRSCPIIRSSCNNSSLVTWTIVCFTAAKFKPLIFLNWTVKVKVKPKSLCDWRQSISKSWCRAPSGTHDQIFITLWQLQTCFCGAPSLTRGRVCLTTRRVIVEVCDELSSNFVPLINPWREPTENTALLLLRACLLEFPRDRLSASPWARWRLPSNGCCLAVCLAVAT